MKLNKEIFGEMSADEYKAARSLLAELGISLPEHRAERSSKPTPAISAPSPYNLKTVITCDTCGHVETRLFEMRPSREINYHHLQAVEVEAFQNTKLNQRTDRYSRVLCPNCLVYLQTLSKEELISLHISLLKEL